ncbi:MAG: diguanylate cyclase domain-containing protein [Anaerovoracaceae bacterium]
MYNYLLKISIYTEDSFLGDTIKNIEPLDRFSHEISVFSAIDAESVKTSDILIIELPLCSDKLEYILSAKKERSLTVIYADSDFLLSCGNSLIKNADYIWQKPLSPELAGFYFSRMQQEIKNTCDYRLVCQYLDTTIDNLPDLVWYKDLKGAHLKINNTFCQTVNKDRSDIEGRGHYYIWGLTPEDYEKGEYVCLDTDEIIVKEKKAMWFDEKVKCQNAMRQFKTKKAPIFDEKNEIIGTLGIARDVTELKNMQIELDIIVESLPLPLIITDVNNTIININDKYLKMFSLEREGIIGKSLNSIDTSCKGTFRGHTWTIDKTGRGTYLYYCDKILKIYKETIVDVFNEPSGSIYSFIDTTLENNYQKILLNAANTDYLTALNNRRSLNSFIDENKRKHSISLFLLDIDSFKNINDTFGHTSGDKVLITLSDILRDIFPACSLYRMGGDEFLIVLTDENSKEAVEKYAASVLNRFREFADDCYPDTGLSLSIGIVMNEERSIDFKDLYKKADKALYTAKSKGKNRFAFSPD